ncbi:WG repeat-containing protein [Streptomyces erythrochromogenes]|uniref:WG repeat-containing protein n=1 Tax=Streptomyces erythrochromogenes TaxID=285574 RepID=UPI0037F4045F
MTPHRPVPSAPYAVPVPGDAPFGTRVALVDATGSLVRAPDLTAVGPFHPDGDGGLVAPAADLAGLWGYLDGRGRWIVGPGLEWAGAFDGSGLSRFRRAGLFGYADVSGAPVVAARFLGAEEFRHGLAVVRTEDGAGYADPTGPGGDRRLRRGRALRTRRAGARTAGGRRGLRVRGPRGAPGDRPAVRRGASVRRGRSGAGADR